MSVYLFAPLLLHAAPASYQPPMVELAVETESLECCASKVPLFDLALKGELPAGSAMEDVSEVRPALFAGLGTPPPPANDFPFTLAASSVTEASMGDGSAEISLESDNAGPVASSGPYSFRVFRDEASSIKWRFAGAALAISAGGFANWNWGSSRFRFNSEGWFGKDTSNLGMDKLGHAYSSYVLTEFFADGINKKRQSDNRSSAYTGAILAMGLMTYIEVFDGFSKDHGFSHEDLAVDAAGALFSIARRSVPGLREKVDFRLLYIPSESTWRALSCFPKPHCDQDGEAVRSPITDYSGQRYLLALKLSGFERFKESPLRLLELHAGYYARGFTQEEEDRGDPLKRRLFVGVGLNVSEFLFPGRRRGLGAAAQWALRYLQVPYTAVHSN